MVFLLKVCIFWCKETIKFLCNFNWVSDSFIISNYGKIYYRHSCFFWKILFHVCLAILLWNLFYSAQNNIDSKFVYFALLVQLFYSCIFCVIHAWPISVACFMLLSSAYKDYLFSFITPSYPRLGYYFVFFFFTVLIGACLSRVLLMKRKKVSKPRFISLFSVTNDQSASRSSFLKMPLRWNFYIPWRRLEDFV